MFFPLTSALGPVRELLRQLVPHEIHDYIIDGVTRALNGQHVISVVRTGGGKSSYFYGYMLVLLAMSKLPRDHPIAKRLKLPKTPKMILVFPTKGLAEEMECTFTKFELSAVAINEDTLARARRRDENLWKTAKTADMILLSPEQLVSPAFGSLLRDKTFFNSVHALGIDEVHLVLDWGTSGFRKAYTDMGLVLARLKPSARLIAVTATLPAVDIAKIAGVLGLQPNSYHFSRRSNIRPDVRLSVRTLQHGLAGWSFPDLRRRPGFPPCRRPTIYGTYEASDGKDT
ncbi:hypothetical protein ONZ45_g14566 [Pleurotus djamor]|nr:hypothetical protein ONZ45_g14566 [Pleurotus djamor]